MTILVPYKQTYVNTSINAYATKDRVAGVVHMHACEPTHERVNCNLIANLLHTIDSMYDLYVCMYVCMYVSHVTTICMKKHVSETRRNFVCTDQHICM